MRVWTGVESGEPDSSYWFAIDELRQTQARVRWADASEPTKIRTRTLDLADDQLGPAAPDAACRDRVHDPFEDFVSLGFVRFDPEGASGRTSWAGHQVRGDGSTCREPSRCCAALSCGPVREVEPNAAGCQLGHWREKRGPATDGAVLIELESSWSNGQKGSISASARRLTKFNARAGRTLEARTEIRAHGEAATQSVQIVALDRCDGIQPLAKPSPHAAAWFDALPPGSPGTHQP